MSGACWRVLAHHHRGRPGTDPTTTTTTTTTAAAPTDLEPLTMNTDTTTAAARATDLEPAGRPGTDPTTTTAAAPTDLEPLTMNTDTTTAAARAADLEPAGRPGTDPTTTTAATPTDLAAGGGGGAAVVVEPPEGGDPRPGDFRAIQPGDSPTLSGDPPAIRPGDFNPADPSHLATFAAELSARMGVQFIPSAKERPGDPTAVYANGATRTVISVGFPHPCEFWAYLSVGSTSHVRTGRSYGTGPVALAWVISRILSADLRTLTTAAG